MDEDYDSAIGCFGLLVFIVVGLPILGALWQLFSGGF